MKQKSKSTHKYSVGTKLNYLTILKYTQAKTPKKVLCLCECGRKKEFYLSNIIPKPNSRYTLSCGCKRGLLVGSKVKSHGMSKSKFYKRWRSMFDRTLPSYICSESYQGIVVDNHWKKFESFLKDMYDSYIIHRSLHGERKTTLDRINVLGNYCKKNCRWATPSEQASNQKRNL